MRVRTGNVGLFDALFRRPLSREAFADRARDAILSGGDISSDRLVFDPASFAFTIHTGREQAVLGLDQVYREYRATGSDERDQVFAFLAATASELVAPPLTAETASKRLLLQIRPRGEDLPPLHRVITERLAVCLCLDSAVTMRFIVPSDLESWGLAEDSAFDSAYANLKERSSTPKFVALKKGVFRSAWLDTYDAARAVLPGPLHEVLGGKQPVLTIPNRETLLVADRADEAAVRALVEETEHQFQQPRPISQRLLTYTDGVLQPLDVARDDPLYRLARRQDLLDLVADYVAVRDSMALPPDLAAALKNSLSLPADFIGGGPSLVLPGLAETPSGEQFSFARWQEGVQALLPATDLLALIGSEASGAQPLGAFPLERLLAICGELLEQQGEYPRVYLTHGFPGAEQRARLGPSLATIGPAKASELRSVVAKRM